MIPFGLVEPEREVTARVSSVSFAELTSFKMSSHTGRGGERDRTIYPRDRRDPLVVMAMVLPILDLGDTMPFHPHGKASSAFRCMFGT